MRRRKYGKITIDLDNGETFINGEKVDEKREVYYNLHTCTHGELGRAIIEMYNVMVREEDRVLI
jgi:hypothetical protein